MSDVVAEIKNRLDIVSVVSSYVQLKKAGQNFKGLCPFHGEKTPSFVVSPEKQICHCFGCNKGGDIFTFIQEVEGIDFSEALDVLADRAGIKIEKKDKVASGVAKEEKEEYYHAHELACAFFQEQLYKSDAGKKVLEYLYRRGLKDETIKEFCLGFAPDSYEVLHQHLLKKGVNKDVLIKGGFVSSKTLDGGQIYDKFRARLMIPIFNYFGKICGFGGRALKADQMPKYLNSPENKIYHKSEVMYGLFHAKKSIMEKDKVVLVEGYFDVLLPYQEGVQNVVATSGTALTKQHVKVLSRLTKNAVTCFDLDDAGFEATQRAYDLLREEDFFVKTIKLDTKDPADFVKEHSGDEFLECVEKSEPFISFLAGRLIERNDVMSVEGRRAVMSGILPHLKSLSPSIRDIYVREISNKLGTSQKDLYQEIEIFQLPTSHPNSYSENEVDTHKTKFSLNDLLLAILLAYPELFEKVQGDLDLDFFDGDAKSIYNSIVDKYNLARLSSELRRRVDVLVLYAQERYQEFSLLAVENELVRLVGKMKANRRTSRLSKIQQEIADAEKGGDRERMMSLLSEQKKLLSQ